MQLQYTDKIYSGPSIDIDEELEANPWRDCVAVPTIGPEGQFVVDFFDRAHIRAQKPIQRGTTVTVFTPETGIALTKWARERGWVLYEDLCAGDVKGVDASPEHWQLWQSIVKLYAAGRTLRRGALEQVASKLKLADPYHPEVKRRRGLQKDGGMLSMDADSVLEFLGFDKPGDAGEDDVLAGLSEPAKRGKR